MLYFVKLEAACIANYILNRHTMLMNKLPIYYFNRSVVYIVDLFHSYAHINVFISIYAYVNIVQTSAVLS